MTLSLLHNSPTLPIDAILPKIAQSLAATNNCVLHAPPGAGKTTRVPLALLDNNWLDGKKIIMLEPRRLAARAAATRLAYTLGEAVGKTVGYRIKNDTKISADTKIEVVTEGVLTRIIQNDPELKEYGCIIFDEFHERSMHADLGIALAIEIQEALRDELRIMVMSATLDTKEVAAILGDCPILISEGRSYPVEIKHTPLPQTGTSSRIEQNIPAMLQHMATTIRYALSHDDGSILAFLPGAGEINRVADLLGGTLPETVDVAPLYGNLPQKQQDNAILPAPQGRRKVVLATSIAETSLTIEGIRVVIDSGLSRFARFSSSTGMNRLITEPISLAAATQRTGRAGRLESGICYRLWSEVQENSFRAFSQPEIKEADLAPLALELAQWGATGENGATQLAWLDTPPHSNHTQALSLLQQLEAVDELYNLTQHGRNIASLPLHPRLAHMVLAGDKENYGHTACVLAAIISERTRERTTDLRYLIEDYINNKRTQFSSQLTKSIQHIAKQGSIDLNEPVQSDMAGCCVALAYPDRIGMLKKGSRTEYKLSNGRIAQLTEESPLAGSPFIAVAELNDSNASSRIWRCAPLSLEDINELFYDHIKNTETVGWDAGTQSVTCLQSETLGEITLSSSPVTSVSDEIILAGMLTGIRSMGLSCLPWTKEATNLRDRLAFMYMHQGALPNTQNDTTWPDVSDKGLIRSLETWLAPYLSTMRKASELRQLNMETILLSMLDWSQQTLLEKMAPPHFQVPSGSHIRIDYSDTQSPVLPVKLQEMFGATQTPAILNKQVPLTVHLLSPAGRPLQVTRDLVSFWQNGYPSVRAEMRGRYPKHPWPEDPLTAQATRKTNRALQSKK